MTNKKTQSKGSRIFPALFIGLIAFVAVIIVLSRKQEDIATTAPQTPVPKSTVQINETPILVEIVDTPAKRTLGLSYRPSLPEDEGMLFVFENKQPVRFWMKGMEFPLDIIFIADGKIVDIAENAMPQPGVSDENLKSYVPSEPVDHVLEVNAGFVSKHDIKIGDSVVIN